MPRFNRRRILQKTYYILRQTGRPMKMYVRNVPANANVSNVPSDLFAAYEEPPETAGEFTVYGFFGKFEEDVLEERDQGGRHKQVKGMLTVPFAYRSLLAQADYIDPYCDGTRMTKIGATIVDEERMLVYQAVQGTTFPNTDEITS